MEAEPKMLHVEPQRAMELEKAGVWDILRLNFGPRGFRFKGLFTWQIPRLVPRFPQNYC